MLADVFSVGSRWGRLTVIERVSVGAGQRSGYRFRCDCGTELVARPYQIRGKADPKCKKCVDIDRRGKPNMKNRIGPLERTINDQWNTFRKNARNKAPTFISKEEWLDLALSDCVYCGAKPSNVRKAAASHSEDFHYNGVDRIDSDQGYSKDNCQPCCWVCNRMKGNMTEEDFLSHIRILAARNL